MCPLKSLMHVTGIVNYISKILHQQKCFSAPKREGWGWGEGSVNIFLCSPLSSLFKDTSDSLIHGNFLLTGLEKGTRSYL